LGVALAVAACSDPTSATDLHTDGPPMVEQVRLSEAYVFDATSTPVTIRDRTVFAFGTHPMATALDEHAVTTAAASENKLRIIIDELLRGNDLEEIECRALVDDDVFGRVPIGATPDDIARCTAAQDVLPSRCPGSNKLSVCICHRPDGCNVGGTIVTNGDPVGVLDLDQDGAADNTRFINGAVTLTCNGTAVATDLDASYWTPSGDQQKPAGGGFDALGPAVVLVPAAALPTGSTCGLTFAPDVVDKDGNQVCAPPGGDIDTGCTPGDTSAISFMVEPLRFIPPVTIVPTKQTRTGDIIITANVPIDLATLAVTVTFTAADGTETPYTDFTVVGSSPPTGAPQAPTEITIHWTAMGGLDPATHYTITVPTTVTDTYGIAAPAPLQIIFTTSAT
jgi:hypothetical protein